MRQRTSGFHKAMELVKLRGETALGKPRLRCVDNIRMDLKEMGIDKRN